MSHDPQFDKTMLYLANNVPLRKTFTQRVKATVHQAAKVFGLTFGNCPSSLYKFPFLLEVKNT